MDSVTQIALGSAVGYAVLGNKIGRKAALYGAVLGTVPDLDVFVSFGGAVEDFTFHRSFSHSLLMQLLISPLLAWLLFKTHAKAQVSKSRWFCLVFLTLSTHSLLDNFTVYGTQLLWPLTDYPFAISSLFIIDPVYTLLLLIACCAFFMPKLSASKTQRINTWALCLSSLYIGWSVIAKWHIDRTIAIAFEERGLEKGIYQSTPAPFTTLLWRAVMVNDKRYFEIYASVFDSPSEVSINAYSSAPKLLSSIQNEWAVQRLQFFTKGVYAVKQQEESIIFSDLRMGVEGSYVFSFVVGKQTGSGIVPAEVKQIEKRPDLALAALLWRRVWDPNVSLAPVGNSE